MNVCDICKNPSSFQTTVPTNPNGGVQQADLCAKCYNLFYKKKNMLNFVAYQQTVEEVTNKPAEKTLMQKLKFWR